ncbi:hypothetical protein LX36DRAFT_375614 [Colletotrichum falcatum]|nr:hypothetical protein LX36DRAFT_375614 [Colletotrichum falcatum]
MGMFFFFSFFSLHLFHLYLDRVGMPRYYLGKGGKHLADRLCAQPICSPDWHCGFRIEFNPFQLPPFCFVWAAAVQLTPVFFFAQCTQPWTYPPPPLIDDMPCRYLVLCRRAQKTGLPCLLLNLTPGRCVPPGVAMRLKDWRGMKEP